MSASIQVLLVEDSDEDAVLIIRELRRSGLDVSSERVDSGAALERALQSHRWDVILADHQMPGFDTFQALAIVRAVDPDVPYVVVSGAMGEELAVEAMRSGAQDYVMKDKLVRLGPVVKRELRETQVRRERARALADLRESEALKAAVLEASLDAVITMNHEGNIVEFNRAAERMFGYAKAEVAGRELVEVIIAPSLRVAHRQGLSRYLATGEGPIMGRRVGLPAMRRDGSEFPAEITVVRIARPGPPMFTGFIRDVTETVRLFEQVEDSLRARDEFIAIAAHELRTPLTPLWMQAQTLAALVADWDLEGPIPQKIARSVRRIVRASERLIRLVEKLLDISRVTVGEMQFELEPLDLVRLVKDIVAELSDDLDRAGATVVWTASPAEVVGEWHRRPLELAVRNLLTNAMKFAPGAPIELSVEVDEQNVRFGVRDRGPGLTAEEQAYLFERYRRPAPLRYYGGFGLGLWLVRRVMEEQGGRVEVSSEPGAGARFTLILPRKPRSERGRHEGEDDPDRGG